MNETATTPSGTIHYRDLGDGTGDGAPILFVHGLLVDGRLWDGVAERLARSHRCLIVDWPMGSHRTPMEPGADLSPPGVAGLVVSFMDALGVDRATLVGNDSGGAVSQMVTAAHPERVERLILTNCDLFESFPPFPFSLMPPLARLPGGITMLTAPFRIGALRRAVYAMLAAKPISPQLVDDWLAPSLADAAIRRDARKLIAGVSSRQTLDAAERLRDFPRPIRFAWAPEDRFFSISLAQRLAASVPDAEIEPIANARTFVPLDQPARVAELIEGFVAPSAEASASVAANR